MSILFIYLINLFVYLFVKQKLDNLKEQNETLKCDRVDRHISALIHAPLGTS